MGKENSAGHTPGPWTFHRRVGGGAPWVVCGPAEKNNAFYVAMVDGPDAHANARLIAAAPATAAAASSMLAALMRITKRLDDQKVHGIDPSQGIEDIANAAIASARAAGILPSREETPSTGATP